MQNNLEHSERLGRLLTVEKGFEDIIEKILGTWLQAVVCQDKKGHEISSLERLAQEAIHVISECESYSNQFSSQTFPSLADKIQGLWLFVTIYLLSCLFQR